MDEKRERRVPWRADVGLDERPAYKCGAGGREGSQVGSVRDACMCCSAASDMRPVIGCLRDWRA
jgi:hypothetical protein